MRARRRLAGILGPLGEALLYVADRLIGTPVEARRHATYWTDGTI